MLLLFLLEFSERLRTLTDKETFLSRRKQGFETPTGRHHFRFYFSAAARAAGHSPSRTFAIPTAGRAYCWGVQLPNCAKVLPRLAIDIDI
jgi:hypothetical protein